MSDHHDALNPRLWAAARAGCLERDGHRCRSCGRAGALEAHHDTPLAEGGEPYALDNLRTLCRPCHIAHHRAEAMSPSRQAWAELLADMSTLGL